MLALVDDFRTIDWVNEYLFPGIALAEIKMLLAKKVSKASIAKILDVSRSALLYFISSRELC